MLVKFLQITYKFIKILTFINLVAFILTLASTVKLLLMFLKKQLCTAYSLKMFYNFTLWIMLSKCFLNGKKGLLSFEIVLNNLIKFFNICIWYLFARKTSHLTNFGCISLKLVSPRGSVVWHLWSYRLLSNVRIRRALVIYGPILLLLS